MCCINFMGMLNIPIYAVSFSSPSLIFPPPPLPLLFPIGSERLDDGM